MRGTDDARSDQVVTLIAGSEDAGQRLDIWLARQLAPDLSRARLQALIRGGEVLIGAATVNLPKHALSAGDRITVNLPEAADPDPQPESIALVILYEDEDIIVVDKPSGMVVHPGAGIASGTLVNALLHHCRDSLSGIGGVKRPGIVHRLDKDTSGVMVAAKNDLAHRALSDAFADHGRSGDLERAYLALCWGEPARMAGTVDAALGRASNHRTRRSVVPEGRADARRAVTHYAVVERYGASGGYAAATLIECRLETGRTHQIRVHMAHISHPLIGDREYGAAFATKARTLPEPAQSIVSEFHRQALHAARLAFRHPSTGELLCFETEPPRDMLRLIDAFKAL